MSLDYAAIPDGVVEVCRVLRRARFEAHLVGGSVRDMLLGRPVVDWDVATSARPPDVQRLFRRTVPTGIKHGTVTVHQGDWVVEVTTYRGDGDYADGRRPSQVEFVHTLEEDLQRRDFTINAIALDPIAGVLEDPLGGREDLHRRVIRAVGDPAQRFGEDGLRLMRAVRLAAVLEFRIAEETLRAMPSALGTFRRVSAERTREELLKLLAARVPSVGLRLMEGAGLLEAVLPEVARLAQRSAGAQGAGSLLEHSLAVCDALEPDALLRLGALLHDVGRHETEDEPGYAEVGARSSLEVGRRLRLSRRDAETTAYLVRHHCIAVAGPGDAPLRHWMRRVGGSELGRLFALRRADLAARSGSEASLEALAELERRTFALLSEGPVLAAKDLAVTGEVLMRELGLAPGPALGRLLEELLLRVLDDPQLNEAATLLALARQLVATER
ncbi:MAG: hypothetical protein IT371_18115 [Deltaproteobacteria bacterium]|nr:hypothetical protein [Deltaproteobacteria bacterium]